MVQAGVVDHPVQWKISGYREIQSPPKRYRIIDSQALCRLTQAPDYPVMQSAHQHWVAHSLGNGELQRESAWTESVAVGSESYIERVKSQLGVRAYHRKVRKHTDTTCLIQDSGQPYMPRFDRKPIF